MQALGNFPGGGQDSSGLDVSADGYFVVGRASGPSGPEAFRWTLNGMVGLGNLPGGLYESVAYGVSADGARRAAGRSARSGSAARDVLATDFMNCPG